MKLAWAALAGALFLAGCAHTSQSPTAALGARERPAASHSPRERDAALLRYEDFLLLNRVTWGANASSAQGLRRMGRRYWLEGQLDPGAPDVLPPEAQAYVDAMAISRRAMPVLLAEFRERRKEAKGSDDEKKAFQQDMNRLARESAERALLRALYSPAQLKSQMTWFWTNHFSVFQGKAALRALVADYEENAIRPNALGRFRDLLGAAVRHPAMLLYLDNAQNAANRVNENYARELLELHTLGVEAGYTQKDVQELARVLTGHGLDPSGYRFYPRRHDGGDKVLLGGTLRGSGARELDEALDLLARHPATARFVSRKMALYFVSDSPSAALVGAMAQTWRSSDGDIASVLRTLFSSAEFKDSLGKKFKDPVHYAVSAVRLAFDGKVIASVQPMLAWLVRMGEPLYGRQTPDGWPLAGEGWASAGQMQARFEIARVVGYGAPGLWRSDGAQGFERAAFPQLSSGLHHAAYRGLLGEATRAALDKAAAPQEWNMLFLASPEFMNR